jgi:hypothetical protein
MLSSGIVLMPWQDAEDGDRPNHRGQAALDQPKASFISDPGEAVL